ncbi:MULTISPECIES: DotG/IcmE/VirB10 family protein [Marinobacter]|uniref:Uncharacterized protein n=1 Tax=Marinobacter nauticus (strain ATCC 700491 / DSM 11845 / VT8) TaxID=351348 RepID=A1U7S5_MARN8|nr:MULTISPECIES: DotG/IcmE/VirB10 family protein [Marinobacter]ABM21044.1 hypothetical protein Maqu_4193 [Marinobacter nauticus VT8]
MSEQSTREFLFSKEGRPALIFVGVLLLIVPVIGYYAYSALYPEAPEREITAAQRAASGESDVEAQKTEGIRPDLTSQNLAPEAREALDEFNARAAEEGRLGQPTPDDVVLIDVDRNGNPISEEKERTKKHQAGAAGLQKDCKIAGYTRSGEPLCIEVAQSHKIIGYTSDGTPIYSDTPERGQIVGYTQEGEPIYAAVQGNGAPGADSEQALLASMTPQERREYLKKKEEQSRLIVAEHEEYRNRRFAAAVELINFESTPASSAGLAFTRVAANESGTPDPLRIQRNQDGTAGVVKGESAGSSGQCEIPLVKGGEIRYAQTDIALNTDFQGPVRMTFLEGNLRGYIGMGTFELNELGAKMKLTIDTLFDPDGQSYAVNGYVLDPNTTLWAMASNVDYHIIYRYGGFGLGTILSAFQTLAENRAQISETVTPDGTRSTQNREPDGKQVTWTVLGEFGALFEETFRDNINRPITVTLDPNEEAGVLFEDTVCELNTDISKKRRAQEKREAQGYGDPIQ